ncbi:uncharacterized protein HaLaN_04527 [Haematococcus lacustris]|uniref:Uncharacterized protein n=1 Tax=Haematococcus lacustris TaxID=44745 RepID=A0A699YGS0_HAELA|nr:uncharacterized protein HaLaN_04527 [Haematococcus lacustris]
MLSALLRVLRSFTNLQASMAAAAAVAAGMLAALGLTSLLLLSLARRYTEVQSSIERPLHFDYSGPVASAWTSLQAEAATGMTLLGLLNPLAWLSLVSRSQPSTPPSLPDQASSWDVSVWVTLQLPPAHADLLQLAGELWGPGPRLLASASKTYMAQPQPLLLRLSRQLLLGPLYWSGLMSDTNNVRIKLFDRQADAPLYQPAGY